MHPYLFELPNGTPITSWGVVITLTLVSIILLGNSWSRKDGGYPKDMVFEVAILIFAGATIGGRIGYVRANWGRFEGNWKGLFDLTQGGSAFIESFLLITGSLVVYLLWRKIPVWNLFDLIAPLLALGQCVGRFACIFAGCCYGRATDLPWGLTFDHPESLAPRGVSLHPTQLYEMGYSGLLTALLLWARPRRTFRGQTALLYLTIYPVCRFVSEFFRGDPKRGWFQEELLGQVLSKPQALCIAMLLFSAVAWYVVPRLPGARNLTTHAGAAEEATDDRSP